jgi:hypothetical protein
MDNLRRRRPTISTLRERSRRAKISVALTDRWKDPGWRERNLAALRVAYLKPERREKIGASSKARWADPEMRTKMLAARTRGRLRKKALAD